jgi:hypothetical protein
MLRSRLPFVLLVVGACGGEKLETITSELEAGLPPTPVYSRIRTDDVTGDNTPTAFTAPNATCTVNAPCFLPDPAADSYVNDEFDRPDRARPR